MTTSPGPQPPAGNPACGNLAARGIARRLHHRHIPSPATGDSASPAKPAVIVAVHPHRTDRDPGDRRGPHQ
jgi:hypothetical protein